MHRLCRKSQSGFTLMELMVAMLVTLLVVGGAFWLFQSSEQTAGLTLQRSETQTEVRAALNQIGRDLSQVGIGVRLGGVAIPSAATGGANPNFACDVNQCYLAANNPFTQGVLYKVTPGDGIGPNITEPSDAIKITYVDPNLDWSAFSTTTITANGDSLTMPAGTLPAVNDPAGGILPGDVILLQNNIGSAVGVVSAGAARTITFGLDPLKLKQSGAPTVIRNTITTPVPQHPHLPPHTSSHHS